ncbi:hypothetical protein CEXT_693141 [Caerostris extrusa]|uniref:Uncharacterized protein n=1 Tax=Caerostris extrusa TaxID=172846 RepID=A0AAV4T3Z0_CAEEX|nr:hypothetical protein CEXT_693141 [Caerostris extrusa]
MYTGVRESQSFSSLSGRMTRLLPSVLLHTLRWLSCVDYNDYTHLTANQVASECEIDLPHNSWYRIDVPDKVLTYRLLLFYVSSVFLEETCNGTCCDTLVVIETLQSTFDFYFSSEIYRTMNPDGN